MNIQAILFDMDGVLVDSEPVITEASIRSLAHYGITAAEEDFKPFTGMGEDMFIGSVARKHGHEYLIEMKTRAYEIYGEIVDAHLKVYENTLRTLGALSHLRLALASSADLVKVHHNLRVAGIPLSTFGAIISSENAARKKPFPDLFLAAASGLGIDPANCIAIDDAVSGVQAAKASGAIAVGITTSFDEKTLREAGADYIVSDIWELVDLVKTLSE